MSPSLLAVEHLSVTASADGALREITLTVEAGEVVALLGANGAGKSTLLKAVMGMTAARGSVRLGGREIGALDARARARLGLGYVPEGRRLFPGMSVRDNLLVACHESAEVARRRLDDMLAQFPDLAPRFATPAWQLSGGQQQMVAVARALMGGPSVLLLDEPSLGLAPRVVDELLGRLRALAREGTAVLLAEQSLARALATADRAYALSLGRIVAAGTPAALTAGNALEQAFLGADIPLSSRHSN